MVLALLSYLDHFKTHSENKFMEINATEHILINSFDS